MVRDYAAGLFKMYFLATQLLYIKEKRNISIAINLSN